MHIQTDIHPCMSYHRHMLKLTDYLPGRTQYSNLHKQCQKFILNTGQKKMEKYGSKKVKSEVSINRACISHSGKTSLAFIYMSLRLEDNSLKTALFKEKMTVSGIQLKRSQVLYLSVLQAPASYLQSMAIPTPSPRKHRESRCNP